MFPKEFKDINALYTFVVEQLRYDDEKGFSFLTISTGVQLKEIINILGDAEESDFENEQQQMLKYEVEINHPIHGKRDHHKLTTLFWAFEGGPLEVIRLHFDYYKTGEFADDFR